MRILFAGTPEFAAAHLQALLDCDSHELVAVYTQPDRRAGRGKRMSISPVKALAQSAGLIVEQPLSLKDSAAQQQLASYQADILVVAAYGLLLPPAILSAPRLGCINVHASLLPHWRGAAPVERAIQAGDSETGVTIMQMDEGLDTGDMLLESRCTITEDETGDSLRQKLTELGRPALMSTLEKMASGKVGGTVQDEAHASYAKKLDKSEARINWQASAALIDRTIRAFTSAMPCYAMLEEQRIKILSAHINAPINALNDDTASNAPRAGRILDVQSHAIVVQCGSGIVAITQVQLAGTKPMSIAALLNGRPTFFKPGQCFAD